MKFILTKVLFLSYYLVTNSFYSYKYNKPIFSLKSIEEKISISQLINDMENHKIENIYFSNDLTKIYSDYSNNKRITNSNPILATKIVDISNKNNINSIILDSEILNSFQSIFIGALVLIIIRNFIKRFQPSLPTPKENMMKLNISLSSWAGSPEIFEECTEIISYLKNNTNYKNVGAEIPRGILLEGPPGTGKTLIAKAIASEADANFISVSASEFVEVFVGIGASKVRNLFETARNNAPCIIFIDEIDAIGRQRGAGINLGNDEREQTLNQILAEMDGFTQNENVVIIAATNRKDVLDSALLRPGRFDRIIYVSLPDRSSRLDILQLYLENKNVEKNINTNFLAEVTAGFSGAEIKNLINEGAINAARKGALVITQKNIEDALEKIIIGLVKKNDTRDEDSKKRAAIHELGHAFLASHFSEYFQLQKVSIQSTYNGAGGYTIFTEYPNIIDSGMYTKDLFMKRLIITLGGKAAEEIFYNNKYISLGAIQDLKEANSLVQKMINNYGMGDELKVFYNENIDSSGNPFLGKSLSNEIKYSEERKEQIDFESMFLLNECYNEAYYLISENKDKISNVVDILLKNITLSGNFIKEFKF